MVKKRRKSKFTENRTARCDCGALGTLYKEVICVTFKYCQR